VRYLASYLSFYDLSSLRNDLSVYPLIDLAPFQPLVGRDSVLIRIDLKKAYSSMITSVTTITTKSGTTAIAHPELRLVVCFREHAVVVYMIAAPMLEEKQSRNATERDDLLPTADEKDALVDKSVSKT
jgi:hypothetical protein